MESFIGWIGGKRMLRKAILERFPTGRLRDGLHVHPLRVDVQRHCRGFDRDGQMTVTVHILQGDVHSVRLLFSTLPYRT